VRNRRAFTLLELIVSMAVAGIIALLVYGSASAGFDTRDTLARHRATAESELRARILLADALRHATDEADAGVAFELLDAMDNQGLPSDQLTFLSRGILPPLGASAPWTVALAPSPEGLVVRAAPAHATSSGSIVARLDRVRGLDVQAMSLADRTWSSTWASTGQLPAAVQLTFYDAAGSVVGVPLIVRLGLEGVQ
jgi:prepilin-type N-terminal cleavage/methylation domain-containing protein